MNYYIKLIAIAILLTFVVCTGSNASEKGNISHSERVYWHLEQTVTVKANRALCSLQDEQGQHIKLIMADIVETYSYDGIDQADIEFIVQRDLLDKINSVVCR